MDFQPGKDPDRARPRSLDQKRDTVILGGGLAGLAAGFTLADAGRQVVVLEGDSDVGGLSRTIEYGDFRFDLGGHRFITRNDRIRNFVTGLLQGEFLTVSRKSKIFIRDRFFDYPLRPSNALFGMGVSSSLKAVIDYARERVRHYVSPSVNVSLEDWVVSNFGRTMFDFYFREYSEKVWGISCREISEEWVSKRIEGLSLWVAIKNAFFKFSGKEVDTLADEFIYPKRGIGQLSHMMRQRIDEANSVLTSTRVSRICHEDGMIRDVTAVNCGNTYNIQGSEFVSSIPLTNFVLMLTPQAPEEIRAAASRLKYRDLVIVVVMIDRERVTDLTWMYLPEKGIPLGRIHEPKNWSPHMAPQGRTHIVSEYFCFEGDGTWNACNGDLAATTIRYLERMGFMRKEEVIDSCVVRVPKAYPLFQVGYSDDYVKIVRYLEGFRNLRISGRSGMFKYYNMDHAIESGIDAARDILKRLPSRNVSDSREAGGRCCLTPVN